MKRNLILTGIVTTAVIIGAVNFVSPENEAAETEVKELIEAAYIHGAFNELNPEAMANGFHKDFAIFSAKGEELSRYEIEDWVAGVQKRQESEKFDPKNNVWERKFDIVDVTGTSAIAKVELSNDGKHVYTDYLSLLKFDTGWKIVAKVYTKH
jgi:hypothetical protein